MSEELDDVIGLPVDDLYIYQTIFDIEFSKEMVKEVFLERIRAFRHSIEKIQKCKFEELDNIFSKDPINVAQHMLVWLKFNFIHLQKETKELDKYYKRHLLDLEDDYFSDNNIYEEFDSLKEFKESFKYDKEKYESHKKIRQYKEFAIYSCNITLMAIKIKNNTHIPEALEKLSFPKEYIKFKELLPEMIKYKKEFGKRVFWKGNISKQFLNYIKKGLRK
nr:MAG: hypothetical protein [uncultured archaeon]